MPNWNPRANELFLRALDIDPPQTRQTFLDQGCGADADLRHAVEVLLAAHLAAGSFLEHPAARAVAGSAPVENATMVFGTDSDRTADFRGQDEHVGTVIAGKYKLIEEIGEGGMGCVYMARQTEPVKRAVAVKVIKAGMDSKAVLARFEAERQALAMMDHPNIARVLDAGTTDGGRPFFVMELVKGVPITEFCDARKLTPKQRLELFIPVCQAIQHAHMKGVIHRDIKPSNVLVTLYDDRPVPKVIDFGVAKATGQSLTDKTLMTGFGAVVGTPEYMSPEQASLNNLDIDTRSDVYSLGVLLYELLTGTTPVDRKSLGKAALLEVLRIVREVEATRPSVKLSTADAVASLSANRGMEPKKLTGLLRNELDWIVVKALEKDRTRRYESANGFAADVQRYLAGEAVQAHPPTAGYRLRKAYRRNKTAVRVASAFVFLCLGAVAMGAYLTVQARRAEAAAERNADTAYSLLVTTDEALQDTELTALNRQIDADLAEVGRGESHVGLLRLARTLRTIPPARSHRHYVLQDKVEVALQTSKKYLATQKNLREFLTAAILTTGQEFAPLLPPVTHDGGKVIQLALSRDGERFVTLGKDRTARLWDTRTGRPVATLRASQENVVECGFSPDGRTIFTDDETMTARFWDGSSGRYRSQTESPSKRAITPKAERVTRKLASSDTRLLTRTLFSDPSLDKSVVELWSTTTGQRISRLDRPGRDPESIQFIGGRWLSALEGGGSSLVILSAEDGREVTRKTYKSRIQIRHPSGVGCSSAGSRVVINYEDKTYVVLSTADWEVQSVGSLTNMWEAENVLENGAVLTWESRDGWTCGVEPPGATGSVGLLKGRWSPFPSQGDLALVETYQDGRKVIDTKSGKQLRPQVGRRYHPELVLFAPDGRFVNGVDVTTEKRIPTQEEWVPNRMVSQHFYTRGQAAGYIRGFGQVAVKMDYTASIRLLPAAEQVVIPSDVLELWLQVCLCGEIGPDEEFVKWDEPTWQQKRQQLATSPLLNLPVPFPGQVATDKTHWWWTTYLNEQKGDIFALGELYKFNVGPILDGTGKLDDLGERQEVRWRAEMAKFISELAPPPREVN